VHWDASRLVFIDETGLNTKMTRLYGRALRSERCICKIPHGHWHTNTFIAGLRTSGLCAPWLLDGPMNGECFQVYIEKVLCPTLSPGDMVICDNLSCHRSANVRQAIEERGAQLKFLPAYSPDLNPIEMVFSKLKSLMRKQSARELDALCEHLRDVLNAFSSTECIRYIQHAQYATN
jgi:transposase